MTTYGSQTYSRPNFSSLIRLGTVSTTCSFTDSPAAIGCCMLVDATGCGLKLVSYGDIAAAWMLLA